MKKTLLLVLAAPFLVVLAAEAASASSDDVMLRKRRRQVSARQAALAGWRATSEKGADKAAEAANAESPSGESPGVPAAAAAPEAETEPADGEEGEDARVVVVRTNVLRVVRRRVLSETPAVTLTNYVTQTDRVTLTNYVTQTDRVTLTNYVTRTDAREVTNVVTQLDRVTLTNYVTRTDVVTRTNTVVETALDDTQRKLLEAQLEAALRARAAAEQRAEAERAARERVESQVDSVARRAVAERVAREKAEANARAAERRAQAEKEAALKAAVPVAATNAVGKAKTGRDTLITADRTDYDRKEGVILFDRNVYVDDEQYQMHADRLFVFLSGTNDLRRLVAIGHVAITNEDKIAYCSRATYHRPTGKVVMYSNEEIRATLIDQKGGGLGGHAQPFAVPGPDGGGKPPAGKSSGKSRGATRVVGEKITFWLDNEQVEVVRPTISTPGAGGKGGMEKMLGN